VNSLSRTIGFAHVADLEEIKDISVRSQAQAKVLTFAVYLLKNHLSLNVSDLSKKASEL
jgi:5-methylthioribose kinase